MRQWIALSTLLFCVASVGRAASFVGAEEVDFSIPHCTKKYQSNDCTGPTDATFAYDYGQLSGGRWFTWYPYYNGVLCAANQCCPSTYLYSVGDTSAGNKCAEYCQRRNYATGANATIAGVCNGTSVSQAYCNCSGGTGPFIAKVQATFNAATANIGECVDLNVELQDANGNAVSNPTRDLEILVRMTTGNIPGVARFYNDSACTTSVPAPFTMPAGTGNKSKYIKFQYSGPVSVAAFVEGVRGVQTQITVNHRIFTTSTTHDGNMGGITGADAICTQAASNAGLVGTWKAVISDATMDARDRLRIAAPVLDMNDVKVADNQTDFWDGTLDSIPNYTETGAAVPTASFVRTGTKSDGTKDASTCLNWTTNDVNEFGKSGYPSLADYRWLEFADRRCHLVQRLYCINQ